MSNVFFISDLHIGHRSILNFEPLFRKGRDVDEHNLWLVQQWNSVVTSKRDVVYVLGDVVFGVDNFRWLHMLNGQKHLIMGNHDTYDLRHYLEHFRIHPGLYGYKGYWLSHAPIHEDELRGRQNIHGHVHSQSIQDRYRANRVDKRYINASVETCAGVPIAMEDLPNHHERMETVLRERITRRKA